MLYNSGIIIKVKEIAEKIKGCYDENTMYSEGFYPNFLTDIKLYKLKSSGYENKDNFILIPSVELWIC